MMPTDRKHEATPNDGPQKRDLRTLVSSRLTQLALAAGLLIPGMGCQSAWWRRPVRPVEIVDSVIHYPGDGGVILSSSRRLEKGICIAPPAQSAITIKVDTSAKAKRKRAVSYSGVEVSDESDREFALSLAESLTKLYDQNEQTLFLQHSLYRLCEAYMNGLFEAAPFSEWLAQQAVEARAQKLRQDGLVAALDPGVALAGSLRKLDSAEEALRHAALELAKAQRSASGVERRNGEELEKFTARIEPRLASEAEARSTHARAAAAVSERQQEVAELKVRHARAEVARQNAVSLDALATDLATAATEARAEERSTLALANDPANCKVIELDDDGSPKPRTLSPIECRERYLSLIARTSYLQAVQKVLDAATELSRIDVERHRAGADLAKAEAEKAKQEVAKAKLDEEAKRNAAIVEALEKGGVDAASKALAGCGDACGKKETADPKPATATTATSTVGKPAGGTAP